MRPFILAAALLLGSPLAAASAPMPLFPAFQVDRQVVKGPTVPFVVDVDLSRRQRPYAEGGPVVLLTVVQPSGQAFVLDSRPLSHGEKLHWEGKIPAQGTYILRVVAGGQNSASYGPMHGPLKVVVTGDEKGNWGVSDGNCAPRVVGICGGPAPK